MFTHDRPGLSLNGTWRFNPDPYQRCRQQRWWLNEGTDSSFFPCFNLDGLWEIDVPGTWKCQFEELKWYDGHANYVREFAAELPADHEAFLCFDGVVYSAEVYLNGAHVGTHAAGYSPFQLRVTEHLQPHNRLFVLVDNIMREDRVPGIRCDWNNDGGIIGAVKLIFVPKIHIANFRTQTTLIGSDARLTTSVWLSAPEAGTRESVTFAIPELGVAETVEAVADETATIEITLSRDRIRLWCPADPKLYETVVSTRFETLRDEIGYREVRTEGRHILLNGSPIRLYGVAVHAEFPGTGRSATPAGIEQMLERARELGCNFLRCAHYPYAECFGRAMDRAGMLWWEEVPVYWLPKVHLDPQLSLALSMLRDTIDRDWNRASLIIWSVSNECAGDGGDFKDSLEEGNYPYWVAACRMVRNLDPGRLISSADSGHRQTIRSTWSPAKGDDFDNDGDVERFLPGHPRGFYDLLDVLGANLYVSTPGANPATTRKWVEMFAGIDKPLMITEFGSMSTTESECGRPPTGVGHPAYHETILRDAYQAFRECPEITGYVPWCLMDVRVPMHWRWYNRGSGTFAYGLLDNDYREKHVFHVVREEIARLKATLGDDDL